MQSLEYLVGAGFLLAPLVYALTLPSTGRIGADEPRTTLEINIDIELTQVVEAEPAKVVEVEPAKPVEPSFEPRPFMFAYASTMVILDADAPAEWASGELFEPAGEASYRAARPVDLARVPAEFGARVGQSIDLYGPEGKLCTAKVERLIMVAQYAGSGVAGVFGDQYDEEIEYDDDDQPLGLNEAELLAKLWATQSKWLVAELALDPSCAGATWARDPSLPAPTILTKSSTSNATARARVRAFRRSSQLSEERARYDEYRTEMGEEAIAEFPEDYPEWDAVAAANPARASVWLDGAGEAQVIELRFGAAPTGGCGGYDVWSTRLEARRGDHFEAREGGVNPIAVFDVDLDGQFELLYDFDDIDQYGWSRSLSSTTETLATSIELGADWYCPC